ncbi:M15 family metallopeptidase [Neobacillus drentensis]|uniref:M15 family metallopeptidase n=2 Tax=Neobacillus drentensis TaxID=220684 RepID=UPI003001F47A
MFKIRFIFLFLVVFTLLLTGCTGKFHFFQNEGNLSQNSSPRDEVQQQDKDTSSQSISSQEVIPVLVNKSNKLPDQYQPSDLIYPDIPFMFNQKSEKRQMRADAGAAIERLFTGAKQQGVNLLGVSAYRSHASQAALFNYYVNQDGYEAARKYSAVPGTSEHETGLAIDVTGGDGKCAAEDCFEGTDEAIWLENHAAEYGFIIRYPKGKDDITGYQYEPWHLRYVGKEIAKEIMERGITLEEYVDATVVNN